MPRRGFKRVELVLFPTDGPDWADPSRDLHSRSWREHEKNWLTL